MGLNLEHNCLYNSTLPAPIMSYMVAYIWSVGVWEGVWVEPAKQSVCSTCLSAGKLVPDHNCCRTHYSLGGQSGKRV